MPMTVSRTVDTRSVRRTIVEPRELQRRLRQEQQHDEQHQRRDRGGSVGPTGRRTAGTSATTAAPTRGSQRPEVGERQAADAARPPRPRTTVMMSSVSGPLVDIPVSGASKMPARAASEQPSAHEKLDTRSERAPASAASPRLSTTARIETPSRVRNSRMRSPMASAIGEARRDEACATSPRRPRCGSHSRRTTSAACGPGSGPRSCWPDR